MRYIHTMESYSVIKKENHAISNNIDGPAGITLRQSKSEKDIHCTVSLTCGI